jgi:hypothetical protein
MISSAVFLETKGFGSSFVGPGLDRFDEHAHAA